MDPVDLVRKGLTRGQILGIGDQGREDRFQFHGTRSWLAQALEAF